MIRRVRALANENLTAAKRAKQDDERRHMTYYERYLARFGGVGAIEEGVAMAYEGALSWPGSHHGAILAFHVVLEGEGLRVQRLYGDWFPCPLFRQINALIGRDEGRHVGIEGRGVDSFDRERSRLELQLRAPQRPRHDTHRHRPRIAVALHARVHRGRRGRRRSARLRRRA